VVADVAAELDPVLVDLVLQWEVADVAAELDPVLVDLVLQWEVADADALAEVVLACRVVVAPHLAKTLKTRCLV
jgi:hypothetical protein